MSPFLIGGRIKGNRANESGWTWQKIDDEWDDFIEHDKTLHERLYSDFVHSVADMMVTEEQNI